MIIGLRPTSLVERGGKRRYSVYPGGWGCERITQGCGGKQTPLSRIQRNRSATRVTRETHKTTGSPIVSSGSVTTAEAKHPGSDLCMT